MTSPNSEKVTVLAEPGPPVDRGDGTKVLPLVTITGESGTTGHVIRLTNGQYRLVVILPDGVRTLNEDNPFMWPAEALRALDAVLVTEAQCARR